jgi:hypothetical protein
VIPLGNFDFEFLRADLEQVVYQAASEFDPVFMFKLTIVQDEFGLTDEKMAELLVRHRRRKASVLGRLGLISPKQRPDAPAIERFRKALSAGVIDGTPALDVIDARRNQHHQQRERLRETIDELIDTAAIDGLKAATGNGAKRTGDLTVEKALASLVGVMDADHLRWFVSLLLATSRMGRPTQAARDWRMFVEFEIRWSIAQFHAQHTAPNATPKAKITKTKLVREFSAQYGIDEKSVWSAIRNGKRIDEERSRPALQ